MPEFDLDRMYRSPANYTDRDLMRAAEERGWVRARQRGSHVAFVRQGYTPLVIPVGVRANGTKREIIRRLQEADDA